MGISVRTEEEDYLVKRIFFGGVKDFYKDVISTIIKKFTFKDTIVDHVAFVLPDNRDNVTTASIVCLAVRFSDAVPEEAHDAIEEETLDYMLLPSPSVVREEGKPIKSEEMICSYWER